MTHPTPTDPASEAVSALREDAEETALGWLDAYHLPLSDGAHPMLPSLVRELVSFGRHARAPLLADIAALRTRAEEAEKALAKIDAIRNSIIGFQKVNWSEHIYPLVAALGEAGFPGLEYDKARDNAGTLLDQIKSAEALSTTLAAELAESRAQVDGWKRVAVEAAIPLEAMRLANATDRFGPLLRAGVDHAIAVIRRAVMGEGLPEKREAARALNPEGASDVG